MSTAQQIIDRGFAKSSAARPELLQSTPELLDRIGEALREWFQVVSREQPAVLGTTASVAFAGPGWARPTDCLRVIDVLAEAGTLAVPALTAGEPVNVVPWNDQRFLEGTACVTELGQVFRGTGQTMDPTGGPLTFVYARAPQVPTAVGDAIDPLFPSFLDDFLQYDLAAYLAEKDERDADMASFLGKKNGILAQSIDWVQQQTYALQQRFPGVVAPLASTNAGRAQPAKAAG